MVESMSYRKGPQLCLLACNPGDRFSSADVISSIEPPKNIEHIISMNFVYQKNSGKLVGLSFEDAIITMNIQAEVLFWSQKLAFFFFFCMVNFNLSPLVI